MSDGFFGKIKEMIAREKAVSMVADDPVLTAELLLLFRVVLADGDVKGAELAKLREICSSAFGIPGDAVDSVGEYLGEIGYETSSQQAADVFAELGADRRKVLIEHMLQIAGSDHDASPVELKLIRTIASKLGFEVAEIS
jgi:uncharacterized tellurite resistance protein B-like protein